MKELREYVGMLLISHVQKARYNGQQFLLNFIRKALYMLN